MLIINSYIIELPDASVTEDYCKIDRGRRMILNSWSLCGWEWEDGRPLAEFWPEDNMPSDNSKVPDELSSDDDLFEEICGCNEAGFRL